MKKAILITIILLPLFITGFNCSKDKQGNTGTPASNNNANVQRTGTKSYLEMRKSSFVEPVVTGEEKDLIKSFMSSASEGEGDIVINSTPPFASVVIDGIKIGKTPITLHKVKAGKHLIKVMLDTYKSSVREVQVKNRVKTKVGINLEKKLSSIEIKSGIPGATVYFDRKNIGITPIKIENVSMGTHIVRLQLVKDGKKYYGYEEIWVNEDNVFWNVELKEFKIPRKYKLIPGGKFTMGINHQYDYEGPVHDVYTDAFYISSLETTNIDFEKIFPSHQRSAFSKGDKNPVTNVTWFEAYDYCKKIGGRLPTEAEWDKAARGGRGLRSVMHLNPNMGVKTFAEGSDPVGSFKRNPYGLYDINGNANEWVYDWFDERFFIWGTDQNPIGPEFGVYKAMKGGSWFDKGFLANLATRWRYLPDERKDFGGFRCVYDTWVE